MLRLVRANTSIQKKSVTTILKEFFVLDDDGWHQKRCDIEITHAQAQASVNREIAEQRETKRRSRIVNETLDEPSHESLNETSTVTSVEREPSHKPLAISHKPDSISQKPEEKKKEAPTAPIDVDPEVWVDWKAHRRAKKAPVTATVMKAIRREAAKAGITFEDALRTSCQRGWIGFEAAWYGEKKALNGTHGSKQSALEERNRQATQEWLRRGEPPREPEIFDAIATERQG